MAPLNLTLTLALTYGMACDCRQVNLRTNSGVSGHVINYRLSALLPKMFVCVLFLRQNVPK